MNRENKNKKPTARKEKGINGGWSEIDSLLLDIGEQPLALEEKGAAYVGAAEVYAVVAAAILEDYKKSLEETIADLKKLDAMGKSFDEKVALAKTRAALSV